MTTRNEIIVRLRRAGFGPLCSCEAIATELATLRRLIEDVAIAEDVKRRVPPKQTRIAELEKFVRDIRDNWDCDGDAHKYGTPCRRCEAEKLIGAKK